MELRLPEFNRLGIRLVVSGEEADEAARHLQPKLKQISKIVGRALPDTFRTLPSDARFPAILWQVRHPITLAGMHVAETAIIQLTANYALLTYFAADFGGGDCNLAPDSEPCQKSAAFLAFIHGWASAISGTLAGLVAIVLGTLSDKIGRRPVYRAKALVAMMPGVMMGLHIADIGAGSVTAWLYIVFHYLTAAFDITGILMASISDRLTDSRHRTMAGGLLISSIIVCTFATLPIAGLAPPPMCVTISICMSLMKIYYSFVVFAEKTTSKEIHAEMEKEKAGFLDTCKAAVSLFTQNMVLLRVSCVLCLARVGLTGSLAIINPFLTAYLGFDRKHVAGLSCLNLLLAIFSGVLTRPLLTWLGETRALQVSLLGTLCYTLLVPTCTTSEQVVPITFIGSASIVMTVPIVMGIKTSMFSADAQGSGTGIFIGILSFANAGADAGFATLIHKFAGREASSLHPVFYSIAACTGAAVLIALSLPAQLPVRRRFVDGTNRADVARNYASMCVF